MKRSAPIRRTPLKRGAPPKATSGLRRGKPPGPGKKARAGSPSATERAFVLTRDGRCIVGPLAATPCSGPLTYGHVRTEAGGLRPTGADGEGRKFAVAECLGHNVNHAEARTEVRLALNKILDGLYPGRRNPPP